MDFARRLGKSGEVAYQDKKNGLSEKRYQTRI